MSGTLRNYMAAIATIEGKDYPFGSMESPIGEATIGGDHIGPPERLSVAAGDYIILWESQHAKRKFQELGFYIEGEGTLDVYRRYDLPTSTTDYTPLGTQQRWENEVFACKKNAWVIQQQGLSVPTLSNQVADNGGLPRLMTTDLAIQVSTIVDKVVLYNPGDDPVIIVKFFAQ